MYFLTYIPYSNFVDISVEIFIKMLVYNGGKICWIGFQLDRQRGNGKFGISEFLSFLKLL